MRLALYLFDCDDEYLKEFSEVLSSLHENIKLCNICYSLSDNDICDICSNDKREHNKICIVESYPDMLAIEKTEEYNGVYHILGGLISPLKGIGISDIRIRELIERVNKNNIEEIMIAFSASLEADTTASYIYKTLKENNFNGRVTRINTHHLWNIFSKRYRKCRFQIFSQKYFRQSRNELIFFSFFVYSYYNYYIKGIK